MKELQSGSDSNEPRWNTEQVNRDGSTKSTSLSQKITGFRNSMLKTHFLLSNLQGCVWHYLKKRGTITYLSKPMSTHKWKFGCWHQRPNEDQLGSGMKKGYKKKILIIFVFPVSWKSATLLPTIGKQPNSGYSHWPPSFTARTSSTQSADINSIALLQASNQTTLQQLSKYESAGRPDTCFST